MLDVLVATMVVAVMLPIVVCQLTLQLMGVRVTEDPAVRIGWFGRKVPLGTDEDVLFSQRALRGWEGIGQLVVTTNRILWLPGHRILFEHHRELDRNRMAVVGLNKGTLKITDATGRLTVFRQVREGQIRPFLFI